MASILISIAYGTAQIPERAGILLLGGLLVTITTGLRRKSSRPPLLRPDSTRAT
jgi:hypothetical protein